MTKEVNVSQMVSKLQKLIGLKEQEKQKGEKKCS